MVWICRKYRSRATDINREMEMAEQDSETGHMGDKVTGAKWGFPRGREKLVGMLNDAVGTATESTTDKKILAKSLHNASPKASSLTFILVTGSLH